MNVILHEIEVLVDRLVAYSIGCRYDDEDPDDNKYFSADYDNVYKVCDCFYCNYDREKLWLGVFNWN